MPLPEAHERRKTKREGREVAIITEFVDGGMGGMEPIPTAIEWWLHVCCYITVYFASAASQNGVGINQQMLKCDI